MDIDSKEMADLVQKTQNKLDFFALDEEDRAEVRAFVRKLLLGHMQRPIVRVGTGPLPALTTLGRLLPPAVPQNATK